LSEGGSRPGTSGLAQRFGFTSRPTTRENDDAEERNNIQLAILGNENIKKTVKLMMNQ
jgi:hypothetical protein